MIVDFYEKRFPVLSIDEDYFLREHTAADNEPFFQYYTDPRVAKHILATNPKTLAEAKEEMQYCYNLFYQKRGIYWTIAKKDDDKMIGAIGFYVNNGHHRGEICYDLAREYWRKGIMSKTIQIIVAYAFKEIGLHRIEAVTVKENIASMQVLEKNGFIREGSLKNYRYFQGRTHDVEMFAITPQLQQAYKSKQSKTAAFI